VPPPGRKRNKKVNEKEAGAVGLQGYQEPKGSGIRLACKRGGVRKRPGLGALSSGKGEKRGNTRKGTQS